MYGFYVSGNRGTIKGVPEDEFDAEAACEALREAMAGLGTTESKIIDVITRHNYVQRMDIRDKYKTMYGKDLGEELMSEIGGSFGKTINGLMQDPEEFLVERIHEAIAGLGTDEKKLVALLCCRTNAELAGMKSCYTEKYGKDMEEAVEDDLSGDLRTLIVSLMNAGRDNTEEIDDDKVREDAQALFDAGPGQLGTAEEVFNSIFNLRNPAHMRQVFDAYEEISDGTSIEDTIGSEFGGSLQAAYLTMVKSFRNMVAFNAERLQDALSGMGTDDETLMEILITRSEVDLEEIADFYEGKYGTPLVEKIAADTSGDYGATLVAIVRGGAS